MKITRRIHLNPQSKGGLGKSFETEFRVAWLEWLDIPWSGSDLDDRHHTFRDRHLEAGAKKWEGAVKDFETAHRRINQMIADLELEFSAERSMPVCPETCGVP